MSDVESALRQLLTDLDDGMLVISADQHILFANPVASALLQLASSGDQRSAMPVGLIEAGLRSIELQLPGGATRVFKIKMRAMAWQGQAAQLMTLRQASMRTDGEQRLPAGGPIDSEDTSPAMSGIAANLEAQRQELISHDAVTGLRRQSGAHVVLQELLQRARVRDQRLVLYFVNLDRFRLINDALGFAFGDAALRQVAERLSHAVGTLGIASHHAGDEFLLAVPDIARDSDLQRLATALRATIAEPMEVAQTPLFLTASVGAAAFPDSGDDVIALARQAEFAARRASQNGRNSAVVFSPDMRESMENRQLLGSRLHDALRLNEFTLHYQPQVNALNGGLIGFEALIRWDSPEFGLLSPGRFIPVAEDSGQIVQIGAWVLREACQQICKWRAAGFAHFVVAVNVSAVQMQRENFVDLVRQTISETGVDPSMLELELTESTFMDNPARAVAQLQALKKLGVQLSLDDFGTGYSSLSYLRCFSLDKLKIDQSFIADIISDGTDAVLVRTMISIGHQLGLRVIAEGVETEAQRSYLRRHHCDEFQGHYFSRAVPADQIPDIFRRMRILEAGSAPQETGRCLLIVDDEENVRRALMRLLRRDGYRILEANGAAEALELLATNQVQVILSDQRMPGMSGTEFLSRVKTIYPDAIRMVLSGFTELSSVTGAVNRGSIYKFLTKPWDDAEMRAHVADAFSRYELSNQARSGDAGTATQAMRT